MEEDLDIRYESLNIQYDEILQKALKTVDETEEKLLSKIHETREPPAKRGRFNKSAKNKNAIVHTLKNFPFGTIKGFDKSNIGYLRDENRGYRVDLDESIQSSNQSDYDDEDEDDDMSDGYGWDLGYDDSMDYDNGWYHDDDDDDENEDFTEGCTIA